MNLGDVKIRVKRIFGDESAVQLQDDDITRWVNDAVMKFVLTNEGLSEKIGYLDVVANQQDYPLPADFLNLKNISYKRSDSLAYFAIPGYPFQQFNEFVNGWDGALYGPGVSTIYTVFANVLKLFPIPDSAAPQGLKIYYNSQPANVVNDIDIPPVPSVYHNAIVTYCLQQCYELDENFYFSQLKQGQVDADIKIARARDGKANQESYSFITIRQEDSDVWG